ncbi:hypothetical protein PHSY_003361 [Pseudozyma hubeiensis SY62]|uniref:Uncharacterized protein n=1 Tax=Pseudozyma hubeiensis (strain SY62) TaxID=1305764 RepID=R9PCJ1_PSEHS|nr:hypothetical protein PHSY_003361 [Pseudozyma hubeiensis SY62]GAC95785.1 hypothetical protein PHSY_003361 [Pseudozyma hubeiensis SY62]
MSVSIVLVFDHSRACPTSDAPPVIGYVGIEWSPPRPLNLRVRIRRRGRKARSRLVRMACMARHPDVGNHRVEVAPPRVLEAGAAEAQGEDSVDDQVPKVVFGLALLRLCVQAVDSQRQQAMGPENAVERQMRCKVEYAKQDRPRSGESSKTRKSRSYQSRHLNQKR